MGAVHDVVLQEYLAHRNRRAVFRLIKWSRFVVHREPYSPIAESAGCFVFHGCVIHFVLHRQILNGVEYDEPVAAAIVDVDRALVFEIEFAKRMEQTVGGRSLAQIQRTIRFTARMSNSQPSTLGSIRSGRAGEPHFVPARRQFGVEPRPNVRLCRRFGRASSRHPRRAFPYCHDANCRGLERPRHRPRFPLDLLSCGPA